MDLKTAIEDLTALRSCWCMKSHEHGRFDDAIGFAIESLERELFAPSKTEKPEIIHDPIAKARADRKKARKLERQKAK